MSEILPFFSALLGFDGEKSGILLIILLTVVMVFCVKAVDVAVEWFKKKISKREKIKGMVKRDEANIVIQELITTALLSLGGDRIQVVEFTNSIKNIALVPFKLMSCTYETYRLGLGAKAQVCQNINTSLFGVLLAHLASSSFLLLNSEKRIQTLPESSYSLLTERGTVMSLCVALKSPLSKKMIGYIAFDSNNHGDFTDKAIKEIRSLSDQIGTLLTLGDW